MGKLFGTDGIRGVANRDLTPELAFRIGRITAYLLGKEVNQPEFLVGRDTRLSGEMLEGSLLAGITSTGGRVRLLGIISTPAVAYLTRTLQASAGVVISASHNPIEDNGLKIFNRQGLKLADNIEAEIEKIYFLERDMLPRPDGVSIGRSYYDREAAQQYISYLKSTALPLSGLRLVLDCGHGAACCLAEDLLSSLGADLVMLHDSPDGSLINVDCGATNVADLQREVVSRSAAVGFAFDGDADRVIAVDEKGNVVDGDAVMSICAIDMLGRGELKNNTLVVTVMSNGGLELLGEEYDFKLVRTAVGDRYVLEKMLQGNYNLGGEQSGHIIFTDHATTGDGLLTALQILKVLQSADRPLSELAARLTRLPQVLVNQKVDTKEGWQDNAAIAGAVGEVKQKLGKHGRILVRPSGTEPKIRVMLEAPLPEDKLREYARSLAAVIAREQSS